MEPEEEIRFDIAVNQVVEITLGDQVIFVPPQALRAIAETLTAYAEELGV